MVNHKLLKKAIKKSGLKGVYIAHKLGVQPSTYYFKLSGERKITLEDAQKFRDILNLTQEQFNAIFFA